MKKSSENLKSFTVKDVERLIENDIIEIVKSIVSGKDNKLILDMIKKPEINIIQILADAYVMLYKMESEIRTTQAMIKNRDEEMQKLLDLCNKSLSLALSNTNDEKY